MKFDCGDKEVRLAKKITKQQKRFDKACEWHKKFKIYKYLGPHDCRVLEVLERRIKPEYQAKNAKHGNWTWIVDFDRYYEYRPPIDE